MCPHAFMLCTVVVVNSNVSLSFMCPHVFCACVYMLKCMCAHVSMHMYSCCSKCRRRKGRSAFRKGSRQSARKINSLYDIYALNGGTAKQLAAQKLRRWEFNLNRRCSLSVVCNELLIRCPGHEDDLFPAVDFRDRLHGLFTFLFWTLITSFPRMGLSGKIKEVLDQ